MSRVDNRLQEVPMRPLRCEQCGTEVNVRKASWQQTSIQWNAEAAEACLERRAWSGGDGPNGGQFPACEALRDTVVRAAAKGLITVAE